MSAALPQPVVCRHTASAVAGKWKNPCREADFRSLEDFGSLTPKKSSGATPGRPAPGYNERRSPTPLAPRGTRMSKHLAAAALVALALAVQATPADDKPARTELPKPDKDGFITIFNGKNLDGWEGLEDYWTVKDGVISGHETKDKSKQTFLVWKGAKVGDFELHLKYKFATEDGNSGIQFRSKVLDEKTFKVGGYQADFDGKAGYDGSIYDEAGVAGGRGTMSNRGEKTTWDDKNKRTNEKLPDSADLKKQIKVGDWNDVVLIAKGNHITYSINGHLMTDLTDDSPKALKEGVLALQLHAGFTMDIQFKDIKIKLPENKKPE
jgi:hypothetical protein